MITFVLALVATAVPTATADADEIDAPVAGDEQRVLVAVSDPAVVDDVAALADRVGAEVGAQLPSSSAVTLTASAAELAQIESVAAVVAVTPDIPLDVALADTTPLVNATTTTDAGFDGSGRAVVVIDSGVQIDHEFFGGRVIDGACFSHSASCPNDETSQTGLAAGAACTFVDGCFHGTHVAGIIAGSNNDFHGVAPGASILSIMAGSEEVCSGQPCLRFWTSDLLASLQQAYDWSDEYDIAAVNMSLGGGWFGGSNCDSYVGSTFMQPLITDLRSVGIETVIAAGNSGYVDGISFPACISNAIAVGATDKDDEVAWYTNSSPALDMWAPGSDITSSVLDGEYGEASGTSMAAPHVAGAFAVVDELMPDASLETKEYRVVKTGPSITDPGNDLVRRRLMLRKDLAAPSTRFTQRPASTVTVEKVTYKFAAEAGAKFECKLDAGGWKSCSSPKNVNVVKGSHTFKVRARDVAGNVDATPSSYTWRRK